MGKQLSEMRVRKRGFPAIGERLGKVASGVGFGVASSVSYMDRKHDQFMGWREKKLKQQERIATVSASRDRAVASSSKARRSLNKRKISMFDTDRINIK